MSSHQEPPSGSDFSDFSSMGREVTNEMLAERIEGLRGLIVSGNAERIAHTTQDRLEHAEFRLAIAGLTDRLTVTRTEFRPVQMLVYSMVGTILLGVLGALVTLVVRSGARAP